MIVPRGRLMQIILAVGFLFFLSALSYANYQFALRSQGGVDFLIRWLGTRMWITEGISPYDQSVSLQAEEMIYGRPARPERGEDPAGFVYPLPAALFVAPFSVMPLALARAVWMTILELALPALVILSIKLIRWRPDSTLLGVTMAFVIFWYPGFRAIVLGDFAVISALLVVAGLLALDRGYDVAAGALFALALTKPQIPALLIPLTIVWAVSRERWRLIASIGLTTAALVTGFMILHPTWPIEWFIQIGETAALTLTGSPIRILVDSLAPELDMLAPILAILLLIYMLWEWVLTWAADDRRYLWTALMTLTISQLVLFRTTTTNMLVLTPAFLLLLASWHERWGRSSIPAIAGLLVFWLIIPWWMFVATAEGNLENPIIQLPLPLFMLAALLWTRWWTIRGRELIKAGSQSSRWPSRL